MTEPQTQLETHARMFARYNRWANQRLYAAAATLADDAWQADTGVFFGSMQRTLNHVLVADRIWLRRITGEGPLPVALDEIPAPLFADLATLRKDEDERIIAFCDRLTESDLAGRFTYRPIGGTVDITQTLFPVLCHVFNHQTHHRGHAHAILTILGQEAPALDLIYFLRSDEGRAYA